MRLFIIRHGETESNRNRTIQGHLDIALSELGRTQVASLGLRLQREQIEHVFSSDLKRAQETAHAFSNLVHVAVSSTNALRERSYGEFEGRPVADYETALRESGLGREAYRPNGGESLSDLERRVRLFLSELIAEYHGKSVALFAHAGTNRMLLKILLKKSFADWTEVQQDNACVNVLQIDQEGNVEAQTLNCISHLAEGARTPLAVYE